MSRTRLAAACRLAVLIGAALACHGGQPGWRVDGRGGAEATADALWPVRFAGFQNVWLDPDESFAGYTHLWLAPPTVYYKDAPEGSDADSSSSGVQPLSPNFRLTERQQVDFIRYLVESFTKELSKSRHFALADKPGPGTLVVAPVIRDLVMMVPLGPMPGGQSEATSATARMTLVLELRDGVTLRPLARIVESRQAMTPGSNGAVGGYASTPTQNAGALRSTFSDWARQLRIRLDATRAHAVASGPPISDS